MSNSYLRSLYAYAQFLDDHGNIIKVATDDGQNADYLPISVVTPVNILLGIPLPTEPTVLSFYWAPARPASGWSTAVSAPAAGTMTSSGPGRS